MRHVCAFVLVSLEKVQSSVEDWGLWLEEPGMATGSGHPGRMAPPEQLCLGKRAGNRLTAPPPWAGVFPRVFLPVLEMSTLRILHAAEFSFSDPSNCL